MSEAKKMTETEVLQAIWRNLTINIFTQETVDYPVDNPYLVLERYRLMVEQNSKELLAAEEIARVETKRRSDMMLAIQGSVSCLKKALKANIPFTAEVSFVNSVPADLEKITKAIKPFPFCCGQLDEIDNNSTKTETPEGSSHK